MGKRRPDIGGVAALVLFAAGCASDFKTPDFQLSHDVVGKFLDRVGLHDPGAPALVLHEPVVVDRTAGVVELNLECRITADAKTGETLATRYVWRIPMRLLREPSYLVSVARISPTVVEFTLTDLGADGPFLYSKSCYLTRPGPLPGTGPETRPGEPALRPGPPAGRQMSDAPQEIGRH
jgi:hypothetical protein